MKVIKRDGSEVRFDRFKIQDAIFKAYEASPQETHLTIESELLTEQVVAKIEELGQPTVGVEQIQDIVEKVLMKNGYFETAKQYILYRDMRSRNRNNNSELFKVIGEKLAASNVVNQNANVDEKSFGGRKGEASNELMKWYALNNCMSAMSRENHLRNEIYIHDLDSYAIGQHNCLSIPFDDLLANGFNTRQCDIRPASSVNTAFQLIAVIFQLQSLQQFGGVSATHLDWTMVPYVRKSFYKHYMEGIMFIGGVPVSSLSNQLSIDDPLYKANDAVYKYAMHRLEEETNQAVEGMYHNLNTLQSRSGNQLPFTSINYGTCTLPEGRLIIKALLEGSLKGVGKLHKTAIFPCGIFQYSKELNGFPGTPNYDLYKLALQSTAKRLYPNYANIDWSGNKGYDKNDPTTFFSTMGALDGCEHLYVRIDDGDIIDMSIKDFFDFCKSNQMTDYRKAQLFDNQPMAQAVTGTFTHSELPTTAGVYAVTYLPQDVTYIGSSSNIARRSAEHRAAIRKIGGLDAGPKFNDTDLTHYKFKVLELTDNYKEQEKYYIQTTPNINVRGTSARYYKVKTSSRDISERRVFRQDCTIPQELIDLSSRNIKVLDKDNRWVKVRHVFKNDKHNSPFMMHIYYQEDDHTYCLNCTEDHPLWTGEEFTRADKLQVGSNIYRKDGKAMPITKITWHWTTCDSYDIGTETGTFIGSDIIMHNCRTANGYDVNADEGVNPQKKDGRGNICPVTIIMPTLAMQAKAQDGNPVDNFLTILDKKIGEAVQMLIERYEYICKQPESSARFMYENHTMFGYKPEEGIRSALKHGTLAIGQLGLAETLQILIGKNQTTAEGLQVAKTIEELFQKRAAQYKELYHLNFGVYYTPAENLSHTAMKRFKAQYGIIPNVSDKEFFTNSIHVPVWEPVNAFQKIDIESQLTGYSSAGCITYVEADGSIQHNIEALEAVVNYAMSHDIPYFAVNVPNDTCLDCGYTAEFNDKCPVCGSTHIQQLRRVTGYLTGDYKSAFNKGKQQEVELRVKHI